MKYYKVIKENFLWDVGAILSAGGNSNGYTPIDEIFRKHEDHSEYISTHIVEESPEYFTRVYKVDLVTRTCYEVKEKAKELLEKSFKGAKIDEDAE